jgi:hypothetical protein
LHSVNKCLIVSSCALHMYQMFVRGQPRLLRLSVIRILPCDISHENIVTRLDFVYCLTGSTNPDSNYAWLVKARSLMPSRPIF